MKNIAAKVKPIGRLGARGLTRVRPVRSFLRFLSSRDLLPTAVWRRLPPGQDWFTLAFPDGNGFAYRIHREDPFARELFWRGLAAPEAASLAAFEQEAAQCRNLVLDVGAHTGLYSLAAWCAGAEVQAFEPVPSNVEALERNFAANGATARFELKVAAVSDTDGTTQMHFPDSDLPMSASLDPNGFRGLRGTLHDVEVVSLDSAVTRRVGLVKVDVEGFEHQVLAGMSRILRDDRPVIFIECNTDGPVIQIQSVLSAAGYHFALLDGKPPRFQSEIEVDPSETYRNVLCKVTS